MLCPLCGNDSSCGLKAEPEAKSCWCFHETFPAEIFEQLPAEARGKACICKACLEQFRASLGRNR